MKIVAWNCQGAFRKKKDRVLRLKPNILVISECESIERLRLEKWDIQPSDAVWAGKNPNKGLAVLAFNGLKLKTMPEYNSKYEIVFPVKVTQKNKCFALLAVWTKPDKERGGYITQLYDSILYYSKLCIGESTIITGDFNSNKQWDDKRPISNHTNVVGMLRNKGLISLYHALNNEEHGVETMATFYLHKNLNKPYHIDYCFLPEGVAQNSQLTVPSATEWLEVSDHVPMIMDVPNGFGVLKMPDDLESAASARFEDFSVLTRELLESQLIQILLLAKKYDETGKEEDRLKVVSLLEHASRIDRDLMNTSELLDAR